MHREWPTIYETDIRSAPQMSMIVTINELIDFYTFLRDRLNPIKYLRPINLTI